MAAAKSKVKAQRREKGTGTVVMRGGSFYPRLRRSGKDEYGDACKTLAEAEVQLARMRSGVNPRFLPTLGDFYLRLLQTDYPHRHQPETVKLHETFYRTLLRDSELGQLRIDFVKKADVQAFIHRLRGSYRRASLRRWVSCIHSALEIAMEDHELILKNPAKKIALPDPEPVEKRALSAKGSHDLPIALSHIPRLAAMVTVLLDTGMRPGELCALKWTDLDEKQASLTIRHTLSRGRTLKTPKDGEVRVVSVTPDALDAILAQPRSGRFIFTTDEGGAIRPDWLGQHWRRHREKAGVPTMSLRDMRKTAASIGAKIDLKATQDMLGHATPDMTLGVYAEASTKDSQAMVKKLANKVGKRGIFSDRVQNRGSSGECASTLESA